MCERGRRYRGLAEIDLPVTFLFGLDKSSSIALVSGAPVIKVGCCIAFYV